MTIITEAKVVDAKLVRATFRDKRFHHPGGLPLEIKWASDWGNKLKIGYTPRTTDGQPAFFVTGEREIPTGAVRHTEGRVIDLLLQQASEWYDELAPSLEAENESMEEWAQRLAR